MHLEAVAMRHPWALAAMLLVAVRAPALDPRASAPEDAARSIVEGLNRRDGAIPALSGRPRPARDRRPTVAGPADTLDGDAAPAIGSVRAGGAGTDAARAVATEAIASRRAAGGWRISTVPWPALAALATTAQAGTWVGWAELIRQGAPSSAGPWPGAARAAGPAQSACLAGVKQMAMGALIYEGAHGKLPPAIGFMRVIAPYLRRATPFRCDARPADHEAVAINPALAGIASRRIGRPTDTILLYEARRGRPVYPHAGRGAFAFADGHARMLTPTEALARLWRP